MLKKILQAVAVGLAAAGVIITGLPLLTDGKPLHLFQRDEIVSYQQAVKRAAPAVVNIYTQIEDESVIGGIRLNLGSGVIMREDGYLLTNYHVIKGAVSVMIYRQSGEGYAATLVGSDPMTDLAVLKINAQNLPVIPQNPKRAVQVGDVVLAIGNPYNLGQSVTQGIISATGRVAVSESLRQNFIQTDAAISKGNSGGALINTAGELVGINTLSFKNSAQMPELSISAAEVVPEGLNFAIPLSLARTVLDKIIRDGRVVRGYIGVASEATLIGELSGILISSVAKNGPADRAGILEGDVLLKINGREAVSQSEMVNMLAEIKPNTDIVVSVFRNGEVLDLNVTVGEYPYTE